MKSIRALSAWVLLVLLLMSGSTSTLAAVQDVVWVNIVDTPRPQPKWGYAPGTRKIQPGTWVTWSNNGEDAHTVTAVDGSFDSGNLDPSEGFSWFFDQPGTFQYICALHPWMKGRIVVGDGAAADSNQPSAVSSQQAGSGDGPPAANPTAQPSG